MSDQESESFNPYAAPLVGPEDWFSLQPGDTKIRQQFIDCEANLRTIAAVLMLGGVFLIGSSALLGLSFIANLGLAGLGASAAMGLLLILGIIQFVVGVQLHSFRTRARTGAIMFCSLWLLFIPIGTIMGSACLWYLVRPAAKYVLTPEYFEIIQRTPYVQFRTSPASWLVLIIVLFGALGVIVGSSLKL